MEQYINKSVVVTEIEKLINEIYAGRSFDSLSSEQQTALWYIKSIMSFINHLEVKEVNSTDAFIEKAFEFFDKYLWEYIDVRNANCDTLININGDKLEEDFGNYIKGE